MSSIGVGKTGNWVFKCDLCEKVFDVKWMIKAHRKKHRMHNSERRIKTFKYLDIMKNHVFIAHENLKLYCHFYSNVLLTKNVFFCMKTQSFVNMIQFVNVTFVCSSTKSKS